MKIFLSIILLTYFQSVIASHPNVGMVIKRQGKAELLTKPSKKLQGQKNPVLYEGMYYEVKKIRPGIKVKNNNIVRTGKNSKVRIVFKNGDQFNVGEATAYKISWEKNKKGVNKKTTIGVIYGSLRGIISKEGPRKKLEVKSKSAIMGVRGTDFHFYQRGTSGDSLVSVLRGKVEVSPTKKPQAIQIVEQGFSAETKSKISDPIKDQKREKVSINVLRTSKSELLFIQKDSALKSKAEEIENLSPEVKKEIKSLNKKAKEVTLKDIKLYQPKVYQEIKTKKIKSLHKLNSMVVKKAFKTAPLKKEKKGFDELMMDLDEDTYEQYFKAE